jgi:hypothetical protein
MTDTTAQGSPLLYGAFDSSRAPSLTPFNQTDAACSGQLIWPVPMEDRSAPSRSSPAAAPSHYAMAAPQADNDNPKKKKGCVLLNADLLRELRESQLLSQEEMFKVFCCRNVRISIATIKRAETSHAVRYRIAHEFSRYFGVPVETLLKR